MAMLLGAIPGCQRQNIEQKREMGRADAVADTGLLRSAPAQLPLSDRLGMHGADQNNLAQAGTHGLRGVDANRAASPAHLEVLSMTKTEQDLLLSDLDRLDEWAGELVGEATACEDCGAMCAGRHPLARWEIRDRIDKIKTQLREIFATMERAKESAPRKI